MLVDDVFLRDVESLQEFYVSTTGMQPNFLQLSPGVINFFMRAIELDGVTLVWVRSQGRQQWRDIMVDGSLHFGYMIDSAGPVTSRGRDMDADEALVWTPGREIDYVLHGPLLSLEIGVSGDLLDELGWHFDGEPARRVGRNRLRQLTRVCRAATVATSGATAHASGPDGVGTLLHWRSRVLEVLEAALQPWLSSRESGLAEVCAGTRHYQLVRRAELIFEGQGEGRLLEVDELAHELGVPRRTVFHAFRRSLGLGPYRYFELKRLYQLRRQLRHAVYGEVTVTEIASMFGYSDMGRLAGRYRSVFGENPSETLRRT